MGHMQINGIFNKNIPNTCAFQKKAVPLQQFLITR
jgi:hypothetical protein